MLRLEPPGRIVIEKLDMRIGDAHIIVSDRSYAVGRYFAENEINWLHANIVQMGAPLLDAAAIEFLTPFEAEWRDLKWIGQGVRYATADNAIVTQTGLGVTNKRMGIIVAANCLRFGEGEFACGGPRPLRVVRQLVFNNPERVVKYIGTGSLV